MSPRQRLSLPASGASPDSAAAANLEKLESSNDTESRTPTESEIARDNHDLFNLVALTPMVFFCLISWDYEKLFSGGAAQAAWTGKYFMEMWVSSFVYFLLDLIWIASIPTCVKSPGLIIKHHLGALLYLWGPHLWPEHQWFMGIIVLIEINTWFLIARRVLYKRKGLTPQFLSDLVVACFYTTWIVIRCILFPLVLYVMVSMAVKMIIRTGHAYHPPICFIPLHAAFCLLNMKWTYELFKPIVTNWRKPVRVESGL